LNFTDKKLIFLEKYKIEKETHWIYGNSPYLAYLPDELKLKEVIWRGF